MSDKHSKHDNEFSFGTKAETLNQVRKCINKFRIPDFFFFSLADWDRNRVVIENTVLEQFSESNLIVRSSTISEDTSTTAMAGCFTTVSNVDSNKSGEITRAIQEVVNSYQTGGRIPSEHDQVMVQLMIRNVDSSGVVFTNDLNTGAPYYVINYDDQTGHTDTVTSGNAHSNRTLYVHKLDVLSVKSTRFRRLISAVIELENVTGSVPIDIEFALDRHLQPYLLQVRPVTTTTNWDSGIAASVDNRTKKVQAEVAEKFKPMAGVFGKQSVFGQMPDWNPAEIIGRAPRQLALSTYQFLITDDIWRDARQQMGYQVPSKQPLLVSLGGQPYIDARLSFHSFLPVGLPDFTAERLVDSWIARLIENPSLHDKIEFDIAITSFSFDFDERIANQCPNILTNSEHKQFKELHRSLTGLFIRGERTSISDQLSKVKRLSELYSQLPDYKDPISWQSVNYILRDCKQLGTLPFAILARHAFIGQSLLRSLTARQFLSTTDTELFLRSIRTVAHQFTVDCFHLQTGEIGQDWFLKEYGHLRPGTYDILSARYDHRPSLFETKRIMNDAESTSEFYPSDSKLSAIDKLLAKEALGINVIQLFDYIRQSTEAREYAKFIFTRHLSYFFELLASWGATHNLAREEVSHLNIQRLLPNITDCPTVGLVKELRLTSQEEQQQHITTQALRLPQVLFDEEGIHVIPFQVTTPNFISRKVVSGRCVRLNVSNEYLPDITGAIVLIESADPGFDWIFAHSIKGLITKYGGANSHMAIRCAEFGIPAAIGAGEQIFASACDAEGVEINCAEKRIQILTIND